MRNLYAICHKKDGQVELLGQNVLNFSSDDISFEMLGRVYCDDNSLNNLEKIALLFKEYGANITEHIYGNYVIIFKDSTKNNLTVVHDSVTSPFALYYSEDIENIYISTSIKTIYTYCKAPRTLNENVIDDFLANKIINSNETLIDGLYKLCYSQALIVSGNKFSIEYVKYLSNENPEADSNNILLQSVARCSADARTVNTALSSDFESNYILYALRETSSVQINAYSAEPTNKLTDLYDNLTVYKSATDNSDFQNLPDIIWRLEGAMFDQSVFDKYAFFKYLNENNVTSFVSGDCADYVFNKNFHSNEERIKRLGIHGIKYSDTEHPFETGILSVLKKSGIISNSFNIDTHYPFVDDKVLSVAKSHEISMEHFEEICKKCFKPEIYDMITTQQAENVNFFKFKNEMKPFFRIIEKSKWHSKTEKNLFTQIKWKLLAVVKKRRLYKNDTDISEKNIYIDLRNDVYQNLLYLLVFEKLFISGQFDNHFSEAGINVKLKDLF